MAKQILAGVKEQSLNEVAHYLIYTFRLMRTCAVILMRGLASCIRTATL